MSMRVRELQEYLGKFTMNQKGTAISDCPIYIETQDGHLEEIRRIEVQEKYNYWCTRTSKGSVKNRKY